MTDEPSEPRVWVGQCLCPSRHCILASTAVVESERVAQATVGRALRDVLDEQITAGNWNPWCGICGAPREQWTIEVGRTRHLTLEEVEPEMRRLQEENLLAMAVYGGHPGPGRTN